MHYDYKTHGGYSLNDCAAVNFGMRKSGTGELAPGALAARAAYGCRRLPPARCDADTAVVLRAMQNDSAIKHPRTGEIVKIRVPKIRRLTEEQWQQIIADRKQKRQRESASFQAAHPLPDVAKKAKQRGVKGVIRQSSRQPK